MNTFNKIFGTINRCDLYVFLWCIYQLQEILYPPGVINQAIQALIMGWAIYEAGIYMLPQRSLPLMLKATTYLLLMYLVYGLIFIILGSDFYSSPANYLKSFVNSFFPLFLFYSFAKEGYLDEKRFRIYFFCFLILIILQFYHVEEETLQEIRRRGSTRTEITNNTGYFFVSLLPMLFFWYKNRIIQYVGLCVVLLFVLMGMKRGAIGIAGVCAVWFLWGNIKNATSKKHQYQTIAFGVIIAIVAVGVVSYQIANSEYFQERIEDTKNGNASGRDRIYSGLLDVLINDNSYLHLFVGRGAYSTIREVHALAHQDWLETACNNGILGIIILANYFFSFYKTARKAQTNNKSEYKTCMIMLFFVSFAITWFSMSLEDMPIYTTMPMAFLTYQTYKDNNPLAPNSRY